MKAITDKLADALRVVAAGNTDYEDLQEVAREALAAYDAQQAQPVGLWVHWTDGERDYIGPAAGGDFIAEFPKNSEHAARIVQCVNAHDTLVSALRAILATDNKRNAQELVPDGDAYNEVVAHAMGAFDALAKAGVTP